MPAMPRVSEAWTAARASSSTTTAQAAHLDDEGLGDREEGRGADEEGRARETLIDAPSGR